MDAQNIEQRIKEKIRSIPDYPKKGIIFRDITPLLRDKDTFNMCIDAIAEQYNEKRNLRIRIWQRNIANTCRRVEERGKGISSG